MRGALLALLLLTTPQAHAGTPCQRWHEVVDGADVRTRKTVDCDGMQGPKGQFAELLKDGERLEAEKKARELDRERAASNETVLRTKLANAHKERDGLIAENARLAATKRPPRTWEWYEHPALWSVMGLAVGAGLGYLIFKAAN
jgi:hypothetical protein